MDGAGLERTMNRRAAGLLFVFTLIVGLAARPAAAGPALEALLRVAPDLQSQHSVAAALRAVAGNRAAVQLLTTPDLQTYLAQVRAGTTDASGSVLDQNLLALANTPIANLDATTATIAADPGHSASQARMVAVCDALPLSVGQTFVEHLRRIPLIGGKQPSLATLVQRLHAAQGTYDEALISQTFAALIARADSTLPPFRNLNQLRDAANAFGAYLRSVEYESWNIIGPPGEQVFLIGEGEILLTDSGQAIGVRKNRGDGESIEFFPESGHVRSINTNHRMDEASQGVESYYGRFARFRWYEHGLAQEAHNFPGYFGFPTRNYGAELRWSPLGRPAYERIQPSSGKTETIREFDDAGKITREEAVFVTMDFNGEPTTPAPTIIGKP